MGITINGLETRFLKPRGGENPFKSAKPFDDNIDYNSLEDGDLFYIELKERWEECAPEVSIITKVSPEVLNDPYVDYLQVIADESGEITHYSYQDYYLLDNSPMNTENIPSHESWTTLIDSIKGYQHLIGPGKQAFLTKVKQLVYKKDYKLYNTITLLITSKNNTSWQA